MYVKQDGAGYRPEVDALTWWNCKGPDASLQCILQGR
jgi:hypothetical protein